MKSGRSGAFKPGKLNLAFRCKASKCSDAGTGYLGVLTTHETSSMQMTTTRTTHLATRIRLIKSTWNRSPDRESSATHDGERTG